MSLEESRRAIDSAANFKGEVVATSSHHALVKVSELVAIRVEKDSLNQDMQIGEKLPIQYDENKAQIYQQGKEPAQEEVPDAAREVGR